MSYGGSSAAGNRVDQTGFCYGNGRQSAGIKEEGFENNRYLCRNDTEHEVSRTTCTGGQVRPGGPTEHDRKYSIEEESNLCDRPVTKTVTAGDGQDSLDPNDTEYWATVSRLTRQAFLLNDDSLSDSNYPDVVKNIVRRSRMTIRAMDEYDAPPLEQQTGCQCDGCVEFRVRGSKDMTETDESEWEDTAARDNRSYEMDNKYNYSEGMAPRTYTPPPPPLRKKRGRKYASLRKYETDIEDYFSDTSEEEYFRYETDMMLKPLESAMYNDNVDTSTLSDERYSFSQSELTGLTECDVSICDDSDDDFFRDKEWPIPEHMVIPRRAADNVNRTVRNRNNNRGRCSWPGSENDITNDENSNQVDRPFTELATAGAGIKNDSFSVAHVKCGEIPVTKLIPVGVLDTEEQLVMRVSTITSELSEAETSAYSETDINDLPIIKECVSTERRRREELSAYADTQLVMNNYRRGNTDCCFGVCGMTDSLNRSEIGWCWDCVDRLLWGYRASCLVTIVIKDRSYGIDLFTEERRVYTSGLGLVGDPMWPYDVISVYMMMNENFKGGLNNVMLWNKAPVDSRYHQRSVNNRQEMETRASVNNKPIRVKGRFGCLYSPVRDADWSDVRSVDFSPVGDDVWT